MDTFPSGRNDLPVLIKLEFQRSWSPKRKQGNVKNTYPIFLTVCKLAKFRQNHNCVSQHLTKDSNRKLSLQTSYLLGGNS